MKNKLALITGSTSGIGLEIAKSLAAEGVNIILNGFGEEKQIKFLQKSINKKFQVNSFYVEGDLSKISDIHKMFKKIISEIGEIDILVNNAGIQHVNRIESFSEENWNQVISVNLTASFVTTKLTLSYMRKNNWGRIINIASVHGLVGSPYKSAYVASKHGLVGLTKVTALETANTNITCNAICPGWVLTPLVEKQIKEKSFLEKTSLNDAKKQLLLEKQPSGEFIDSKSLGALTVFLCGPSSSQITGATINIDGGWISQ